MSENTGTPDNPFEEAIFGNNKIKEEHDTVKLKDGKVIQKCLKH